MKIGDRVKIARDEKKYPARGTWRKFRNKYGQLEAINKDGKGPWEYGVNLEGYGVTWFKKHEIRELYSRG